MATFKTVVSDYKRADNTWNIRIRIFHNGKIQYITTNFYADKSDLTRSLKLKNQYYIDACEAQIKEYRKKCDMIGFPIESWSVEQLRDYLLRKEEDMITFIAYGRNLEISLRETNAGVARNLRTALNSFEGYLGKDINIVSITKKLVQKYVSGLKGNRAPSLYLDMLRKVHNKAKAEFNDEDLGIISIPLSPFSNIEMPKVEAPRKRAISVDEIKKIILFKDASALREELACDTFLLSFFLIGMNAIDLYECTECSNDRITYYRAKTRTRRSDKALFSVLIPDIAKPLIEKYRDVTGQRVFNFYKRYSTSSNFNHALSIGLRSVGEKLNIEHLQFYSARHSWATIARNKVGIDKDTINSALNHIDVDMKVTDLYIDRDWSNIDVANKQVIDYTFG